MLLQAHFSTQSMSGNLALDLLEVLLSGSKIASSNGYQEQPTACHQKRLPLKEFKGKAEGSNLSVDVMNTPPTRTRISGIAVVLFSIRQRLHHHDQVLRIIN